ncbi:MAG: DUF1566 domain-containing protein [Sphingobacteriia bacterium]|nr:DUF1566 domain-containing protein [Sphingobacteriia bacterium]NCC40601.1 DUF1566 domain-containing protein [Gammaproteobacteria bacterium]
MRRPLIVFGWLLCAAVSSAQAQQVCRNDIRPSAPDSRYRDNGDQTVTDLATGLIWKRCAEGLSGTDCTIGTVSTFTWRHALQHAASNAPWRLPNKKELASLVEQSCYEPSINSRFFPNTPSNLNTPSSWFWSSSPFASNSDYARQVNFYSGYVGFYYKDIQLSVRLVRGGQ